MIRGGTFKRIKCPARIQIIYEWEGGIGSQKGGGRMEQPGCVLDVKLKKNSMIIMQQQRQ